jgi:hypothetical protein
MPNNFFEALAAIAAPAPRARKAAQGLVERPSAEAKADSFESRGLYCTIQKCKSKVHGRSLAKATARAMHQHAIACCSPPKPSELRAN